MRQHHDRAVLIRASAPLIACLVPLLGCATPTAVPATNHTRDLESAFTAAADIYVDMSLPNGMARTDHRNQRYESLQKEWEQSMGVFKSAPIIPVIQFLDRRVALVGKNDDPYSALCAIQILHDIGTAECWQVIASYAKHPNTVVGTRVRELCNVRRTREQRPAKNTPAS